MSSATVELLAHARLQVATVTRHTGSQLAMACAARLPACLQLERGEAPERAHPDHHCNLQNPYQLLLHDHQTFTTTPDVQILQRP